MEFELKEIYNFEDLLNIVKILRSENGCPWDKEQTHHSIRNNFIEEVYEVVEAIDTDDVVLLKEELGDVLLHVVFHAELETENGGFDINAVCDGICKKLIFRHPHVFSNTLANSTADVLANWEELKSKEKGYSTITESMQNIATTLPATMRATKLRNKASKVGFDYENGYDALLKLQEEIGEVLEAYNGNGR